MNTKRNKIKKGDTMIYEEKRFMAVSEIEKECCTGLGEQTIVFLAVNKNGDEVILNNAPARQGEIWTDERSAHDEEYFSVEDHNSAIVLPRGTIYKLAGRHLTWEDDPISLKSVIEELPHELRKMNMIKHKG